MSKPAHKIRFGVLQVTIWRNHSEKGNWYSVIPSRGYKQGVNWLTRSFPGQKHNEISWASRVDVPLQFLLAP